MDWFETPHLPDHLPAQLQQHPFYANAISALGANVQRWICGPPDEPLGTAIVLLRQWPVLGAVAHVSRGPVWHPAITPLEARLRIEDLVRTLQARTVLVSCDPLEKADPLAGGRLIPVMTPATIAQLSLEGSQTTRLARQQGKWRNRLRRAQDAGLTVQSMPMPTEADHWLLQAEIDQARKKNYKGLPPVFALAWRLKNGPASTRLFLAKQRRDVVSAMLFLKFGKLATYQIGWSNEAGYKANAHNLLLWEASDWFARRGVKSIDLGTLDTTTAPGLARFKLGAGAGAIQLGATYLKAPATEFFAGLARPWVKSHQSLTMPCSSRPAAAPPPRTLASSLSAHPRA